MAVRACSSISCADIEVFGVTNETCTFDADPDVAGIGVLLSFIIVGAATYLLSVYIFFYVEHGFSHELFNDLDRTVIRFVERWTPFRTPPEKERPWCSKFRTTLSDIVIMLSDQQLVLGFSILSVGYFKFGSTTQYHFAIISALSNISFVVHVSTVPILKQAMFSDQEKVELKNFKRLWRAIAKLCFDILLFVSLWPTGNSWWLKDYGISVNCIWRDPGGNYHGTKLRMMVANMVLLTWGIWYEISAFFPAVSSNKGVNIVLKGIIFVLLLPKKLHLHLVRRRGSSVCSPKDIKERLCFGLQWISWVISVSILACSEVVYSQSLRFTRNWAMLISNSYLIFKLRARGADQGRIGNENAWSFGQGVAMFVLLLPLCLALELYYDHWMAQRKQHSSSSLIGAASGIAAPAAVWLGDALRSAPGTKQNARLSPASRIKAHCTWSSECLQCSEALEASRHANGKSPNAFYFGYPEPEPHEFEFEKALYQSAWFQMTMTLLSFSIFIAVTYWAVKGWAF
ncbi:hypothetical protein HII31_03448 [Pseudocercospora fuligena]|uniref:Uncharacterized protein n=1 Tax=Pseudocercospora fuligena TaxID=685502 RepID=A0A8H6RQ97_9PEZI|nr:hypothetical protein HII31_03448 [Pseudocercospora fuligena]